MCVDQCQLYYIIKKYNCERYEVVKGDLPVIKILESIVSNKHTTIIQNVELFGIDLNEFSHVISKRCAAR